MPLNISADGSGTVLTVRAYSGIAGDMICAGLLRMTGTDGQGLEKRLAAIMPELSGAASPEPASVQHIAGWRLKVSLPHQHAHRTLADCEKITAASGMDAGAKDTARTAFRLVAEAEARVHGAKPEEVHFHEIGALDSILDICLASQLFHELAPGRLVVSPLPVCDGSIVCAHGVLPCPAPAVAVLLEGVPVRPFPAEGETVTPTGLALLKAMGAIFGPWPAMRVTRMARVYGSTVFPDAPNGALFAFGASL